MIQTKAIDLDTIQRLLAGEKKREDDKYVRKGEERLRYIHGYDKKFDYLFDLPADCMYTTTQPYTIVNDTPYWRCIGCMAIVKDKESHHAWHKRELG